MPPSGSIIKRGSLSFSIEGRILRELGERLVKRPEVAILELVKNAYDADATECTVDLTDPTHILVHDDGYGMNLDRFISGWMRIGTRSKAVQGLSPRFARCITGEKGIGRFAVRFLGRKLHLESVADDAHRQQRTRLLAEFDWPEFDRHEDLGVVHVPYILELSDASTPTGTALAISDLRSAAARPDLHEIRTTSLDVVSPLGSLLNRIPQPQQTSQTDATPRDPGFALKVRTLDDDHVSDVGATVLDSFTLRAVLTLTGDTLDLRVLHRHISKPFLRIVDTHPTHLRDIQADIRFFPRRRGAFANLPIDGRRAYTWIARNSGVAVFDRRFRVSPYGTAFDDWLQLDADAARNRRDPRSTIATKHFPMSEPERASTSTNWMLRLPQSAQLVGLVSVEGERSTKTNAPGDEGLIAAADREGFVENAAFRELHNLIRGAVEALAYVDRRIQQAEESQRQKELAKSIRRETRLAIAEIRRNTHIPSDDKEHIVAALSRTQRSADEHEESARDRERQLEVMSLLGVVAGFMTHEFDVALGELDDVHEKLTTLGARVSEFRSVADAFSTHIERLRDFAAYASGYVRGAITRPAKPYRVQPRLQQVRRIFGEYAKERNIDVEITADAALLAPLVPVSLYNGVALNLYTNALKAVTGKTGGGRDTIAMRAWNDEQWHYLEVADTGVGLPSALKERVFDPLFTTTGSRPDPLGSGMGLGLTLVRRSVQAYRGRADVVEPPPGFSTCLRVKLPLQYDRR